MLLLMGGSLFILGKLTENMTTRGDFCMTQLYRFDAKYHKALLQMSQKCYHCVFRTCFIPYRTFFYHITKNVTVINFEIR